VFVLFSSSFLCCSSAHTRLEIRGFISGLAIVLTAALSYILWNDTAITVGSVSGVAAVCISVANYGQAPVQPPIE
jgi:hypothetical protein